MNPDEVLKSIEEIAPARGWPIIGPIRGKLLDEVVTAHGPDRILEVGTNVGYSAIRMARHLAKGQKLVCIEIRDDMARAARSNFEKAGLSDRIEVVIGDALRVIPTLKGPLDMVFLDAVKDDYLAYLKSAENFMHAGSVVVADNVKSHASEVKSYLHYVRESGAYSSKYREAPPNWGADIGDAVEVSVML